jgi:ParB family chromosome partitioning protein
VTPLPKRGLGRGLASLIPDSALDPVPFPERTAPRSALRTVPIAEIRANPEQPRRSFEPGELQALADSVRAHGVLAPLICRREDGYYVLIAGERRLRAAALAGLAEVPVIVRDAHDAGVQLELALVENLQRVDLDPIEAARGYARLSDTYGYTQDEIASRVGKDRSTVANAVRLLKLPEGVLDELRAGRISAGHARAMLPISSFSSVPRIGSS